MSLITLITTEAEKNNISKYRTVLLINNILNLTGKKFNDTKYRGILNKLEPVEQLVLKELISTGYIKNETLYECSLGDFSETINNETKVCSYCNQPIENNDNHEIEEYYSVSKGIVSELETLINEYSIEEYIMPFSTSNMKELINRKDYIIPFYGSGLSIPLNYPSWGGMIENLQFELEEDFRPLFLKYVRSGDYLKAISIIEDQTLLNKDKIKDSIIQNFEEAEKKSVYSFHNNYIDLYKLNPKCYITTNYDNTLTDLISTYEQKVTLPYTWQDIIDMQRLLSEGKRRVFHLHGHIQKKETMIVTEQDYVELYKEGSEIKRQLLSVMAENSLLFLGFSFNDVFFKKLYSDIANSIKGNHFIILPNITFEEAKKITDENPSLRVIGINVLKDSEKRYDNADFVRAVRAVLNKII